MFGSHASLVVACLLYPFPVSGLASSFAYRLGIDRRPEDSLGFIPLLSLRPRDSSGVLSPTDAGGYISLPLTRLKLDATTPTFGTLTFRFIPEYFPTILLSFLNCNLFISYQNFFFLKKSYSLLLSSSLKLNVSEPILKIIETNSLRLKR